MGHAAAGKAKLESKPRGNKVLAQLLSRRNAGRSTGRSTSRLQAAMESNIRQDLSNMNQNWFRKGSMAFPLVGSNSKAFAAFQGAITKLL